MLLSELGSYLAPSGHAPAGTKRLSNLLRSPKWEACLLADWLWQQAIERVTALRAAGQEALLVWDDSVLEKSESDHHPDLCSVRSSKARRLTRIRKGFFHPPVTGRPISVAGLHWVGLLVVGLAGPPTVAAMQWWTKRGPHATDHKTVMGLLLARARQQWGRQVRHVWDRGFAGTPWLNQVLETNLRFVLRWPKRYMLLDPWGERRKTWEIARGKRAWSTRQLYDPKRKAHQTVGVLAISVTHPEHARPLWLVVARRKGGKEPWYLLTSDPIRTADDAWAVVIAYARRWQIEQTWRYHKSELGCESPRVWAWERREKFLLMLTLVYAFLLSLLARSCDALREACLRWGCHRTGTRSRLVAAPLYRLRAALSRLLGDHPGTPLKPSLNSG
ncbi:MAG: hypothetical protein EI684_04950 [Candidatus Viridilinea halotolerans]|uniref:Transposase IS4-like domain-containing protein n=1 Tax=Candidatus Viridilinea halotolerans TaxID=2491704 RepID=A0A426U5X1_9CHLR|nr:MAG: hypothetical protein EI684_04950 [Candidatus Viridilinea halotolerans]